MDIKRSIETLQAAGFHLYRRIVNGSELIGALLVYPPVDLYAELDSLIDGTLVRFDGPAGPQAFNCTDATRLHSAIRTQIRSATETWGGIGLPPAYPDLEDWFEGPDLHIIQQIRRMKAEHGYDIESVWLTRQRGFKCLYRGAVIKVNEELMTAIGVDGKRVAIPLKLALALLDEMGGMDQQQIEEPEALES